VGNTTFPVDSLRYPSPYWPHMDLRTPPRDIDGFFSLGGGGHTYFPLERLLASRVSIYNGRCGMVSVNSGLLALRGALFCPGTQGLSFFWFLAARLGPFKFTDVTRTGIAVLPCSRFFGRAFLRSAGNRLPGIVMTHRQIVVF